MKRFWSALVVVVSMSGAVAHADGPRQEGAYAGVVAPGQMPAKELARAKRAGAGALTWVGFTATADGGAQLSVQSPAEFAPVQTVEGGRLIIDLGRLTRVARHAGRPLHTQHFDTAVHRVTVKRVRAQRKTKKQEGHPAGVRLIVEFKNPVDAKEAAVTSQAEADGMYYATFRFPAGTALPTNVNTQTLRTRDVE